MKKLVFAFVAMAAMTLATTVTSCKKEAPAQDTTAVDSAAADTAAADSAAADTAAADSAK